MSDFRHPFIRFCGHLAILLPAFLIPYLAHELFLRKHFFKDHVFIALVLIAPVLFAIKMTSFGEIQIHLDNNWNNFLIETLYWPFRLVLMFIFLAIVKRIFLKDQPFFGFIKNDLNLRPYLLMLCFMIPLIAIASTQNDFLNTYPKYQKVIPLPESESIPGSLLLIFFELCYGSDFITIEMFFRGFAVLGFIKFAGKDAILPMACFYCTIHFVKPLGECISSFFGGMLLGIVTYHTRSIIGGLTVHLGIAWLMEIGGHLGHLYK